MLPFIDEHSTKVRVSPDRVWPAVVETVAGISSQPSVLFARVIGCRETAPSGTPGTVGSTVAGFVVAEAEEPRRLVLEGKHRFSRYRLTFEIEPEESGSVVTAITHAEFPGPHGAAYRAAVIGTRLHVVATRRLLAAIKRRAEGPAISGQRA